MDRKTILVTGASSGIGKETALTLAKQGHTVIIHGRDMAKTQAVFDEIQKEANSKSLDMMVADLSQMSEVKAFAEQIKEKYNRLDVLINNAGGQFGNKREVTKDGHEKTMAINVFAPLLLTYLLIDVLKNSPAARVVTVSSAAYSMGGQVQLHDIELKNNYSMSKAYGLSKLYVIWIMRHFVSETKNRGIINITFNSCEPGSADTDLGRVSTKNPLAKIIYFLWKPMMWSIQKAAATSIYLATSSEVEGVTGKFYGNCEEKEIKQKFISKKGEQVIWDYCMEVCRPYLHSEKGAKL